MLGVVGRRNKDRRFRSNQAEQLRGQGYRGWVRFSLRSSPYSIHLSFKPGQHLLSGGAYIPPSLFGHVEGPVRTFD